MSQLILNKQATAPSSPSVGKGSVYVDNSTYPNLRVKSELGLDKNVAYITNYSVVAQSPTTAVRTYIAGSAIPVPVSKLQVGSSFRWVFNITKTAAGISASTFDVCFGTAGTTADVARISFTKPAGTAVVDEGKVTIEATIRTIGATGVAVGEFTLIHNGNTAGHAIIPVVNVNTISAGFDMTVASLIAGVCITSGALDIITIQMVQSEGWNL